MPVAVSATLAANEALARKRGAGEPVLPMAFGEAGLPVHPELRAALTDGSEYGGYGPVAGSSRLRDAAAGYWERRGLPTDLELVVAGPGSKPLLYSLLLGIGGDVAMASPSWVSYAAQTQLAGREPVFVPTPPTQGGVPEPDLLAQAVREARGRGRSVRAVIVTQPDNPTGTLATRDTIQRLAEVARELDLVVISDEIYRDLVHDPTVSVTSPAEFAPERTVISTGLSKNLALGGWRLGIVRLPDSPLGQRLHAELVGVASEIWSSPAGPIQHAAAYALDEPRELVDHIHRSRRLHGIVAHAVADRFAAAGVLAVPPQGAFYLYPDFAGWRDQLAGNHGVATGADLAAFLLENFGLGVLPASEFGEGTEALRVRASVSLLYGDTEAQRYAALAAEDPLALPWVRQHLDRLTEVLAMAGRGCAVTC
ncbi:pyridoxal phosphate-dependent aminotransferase [Lipingzhangella sp. LS1_29]|uniref:Aminotransferase n=1 Tax=Lipingzhangella rawalii TaxID=2055835 RepID=A0ABU2H819_9ACTN|nr:pyridoxal phosphate-dependent aminotransferase [Lipingzhangella rawalii]MDS1270980.1 pyridoxal phosphate-dependent aminotransferase [Lipingzhangella rawalii]